MSILASEPGVWLEQRTEIDFCGRGALFLDRDGVINVDHGYVGNPKDVDVYDTAVELIQKANSWGIATIIVTNQSGIGRGYFEWSQFKATMNVIHDTLARENAEVDMVCACAYHPDALGQFQKVNHPMQKPGPGMILAARDVLGVSLAHSLIIGDSLRDMEAGSAAGISGGLFVGQKTAENFGSFYVKQYPYPNDDNAIIKDCDEFFNQTGEPSSFGTQKAG